MTAHYFPRFPALVRAESPGGVGTTYPDLSELGGRDPDGGVSEQGYSRLIRQAVDWVGSSCKRSARIFWNETASTQILAQGVVGSPNRFPLELGRADVVAYGSYGHTGLSTELIASYRRGRYRVDGARYSFALKVGERSYGLTELYGSQPSTAVFLSACNPRGVALSDADNDVRQAELLWEVERLRQPFHLGTAEADGVNRIAERSVLLLGLSMDQAAALGRRHGQNAVLWAGANAVPKVILLR